MDGLIPMVIRSMKRSKTLKQYTSLSSPPSNNSNFGPSNSDKNIINIEEFYPEGYNYSYNYARDQPYSLTPSRNDIEKVQGSSHRRYKSFNVGDHDYRVGGFSMTPDNRSSSTKNMGKPNKQLVRFRSHRLFSCVNGA